VTLVTVLPNVQSLFAASHCQWTLLLRLCLPAQHAV
jgi:hypothetical protein